MSVTVQNYLVYFIVIGTSLKLLWPVLETIYEKLTKKKEEKAEEASCYEAPCARCSLKK